MEITLLLTISTCLTIGNGNYVTGSSVESLKDKADEILQIAGERNPSSLDIPEDFDKERMDYTREMLRLDSLPSFGLVSADILPDFLDFSKEEEESTNLQPYFTFEGRQNSTLYGQGDLEHSVAKEFIRLLLDTEHYEEENEAEDGAPLVDQNVVTEGTSLEEADKALADVDASANKDDNLLPIIENHDDTILEAHVNGRYPEYILFGVDFTPDTCIYFYNIVSNWLNKKAATRFIDKAGIWEDFVFLIRRNPSFDLVFSTVVNFFSGIWSEIMQFFSAGGAISMIVGIILAAIAIAAFVAASHIYCAGREGKGWRFGAVRYGFCNWGFVNENYL